MQLQNRRRLLIVSLLLFIMLFGLTLILLQRHSSQNNPASGQYVDPSSHQIVSNPPGKASDTYGAPANNPVFLGFDKLLDYGLTLDQLNNLKTAFLNYSKSKPQTAKEISIDVDHITTQNVESKQGSQFFMYFSVIIDRTTTLKAKVDYTALSTVRLYLMDPTSGKTIFDSQVVGT